MALRVRRVITGHDADGRGIVKIDEEGAADEGLRKELDETVVHLKAGDVMVQRGAIHNWINRGPAPCVLAVIPVDAKSVEVGGNLPSAVG